MQHTHPKHMQHWAKYKGELSRPDEIIMPTQSPEVATHLAMARTVSMPYFTLQSALL